MSAYDINIVSVVDALLTFVGLFQDFGHIFPREGKDLPFLLVHMTRETLQLYWSRGRKTLAMIPLSICLSKVSSGLFPANPVAILFTVMLVVTNFASNKVFGLVYRRKMGIPIGR